MRVLDDAAVVVDNASRTFYVPKSQHSPLDQIFRSRQRVIKAVNSVSFVAKQGESFGVLGKNGSGKTTLLKMISGGERVTSGAIYTRSRPVFLGVSAALQPSLSGMRNITLGLLAMGTSSSEAKELVGQVAELSGLEEALNRPMNTYSSGMQARLTFAISTALNPDILLIDEALGTGDATFNEVARKRMDALLERSGTVFVVSHSASTIRKTCKRAVWLHNGEIIGEGDIADLSPEYALWGEAITNRNLDRANEIVEYNKASYQKPQIELISNSHRLRK